MEQKAFRNYSIWGQMGLWFALLMIYFMDEAEYSGAGLSLLFALYTVIIFCVAIYTHYFLILPLFINGKKWQYFTITTILLLGTSYLFFWFDSLYPFPYPYEPSFWGDFIYNFCLLMIFLSVSSLYYFVDAWYLNFKKESDLRNEKLQAELNFLKSQINPHFLFNTLNNIYSYAQTNNPKTAPMLERLSSILRFMVYDCSKEQVILNKELHAIEDLLEIYKMKNSAQKNILLQVENVKGFHLVAPLIIINLVENACKHSDVVSNKDGFIKVIIRVDENDLCHISIANSIKKVNQNKDNSNGIGLQNIQKRLDLQYQDQYEMNVKVENNAYLLDLSIPLERKE